MSPKQLCVFCGNEPQSKPKTRTSEMAIKADRNFKSNCSFRQSWSQTGAMKQLSFRLSPLHFQHATHATLSSRPSSHRLKVVISDMLNLHEISSAQLIILLNWLDKIRVGLWLGTRSLNGNHWGVTPKFSIKSRIGMCDRVALIYRASKALDQLFYMGCKSPIFNLMPSCFVIAINDLYILNISSSALFSPRLGLPEIVDCKLLLQDNGQISCRIAPGNERTSLPLIDFSKSPGGTEIYQPNISYVSNWKHDAQLASALRSKHVKDWIPDPGTYQGHILYINDGMLKKISPVSITRMASKWSTSAFTLN